MQTPLRSISVLSAASLLAMGAASAAQVSLSGLWNTGVDASGTALSVGTPGGGAADPHYTWASPPPVGGAVPVNINVNAFPGNGPWLGASTTSSWISPQADTNGAPGPGSFVYRTTFTVPAGVDPSQVWIRGVWAADDPGTASVLLNGANAGVAAPPGFGGFSPQWMISTGFVTGVNTLDFSVPDAGACCTGVRVEMLGFHGLAGQMAIPGLVNSGATAIDGSPLGADSVMPGAFVGASAAATSGSALYVAAGIPSPPWVGNTGQSAWVTAQPGGTNQAPADYFYTVPFDLTGLDPSTASINGRWTTDNNGLDIYLNGVATGNSTTGDFTNWFDFSVSAAEGDVFNAGMNYLTFAYNNAGAAANPGGARWEFLTAVASPIPEPGALALLAMAGATLVRRRRVS